MKRHNRKTKTTGIDACKTTGKIGLSESAANRRLNKYEEIVRYYHCDSCGLFHLTSETPAVTLGREILNHEEENKLLKIQITELKQKLSIKNKLLSKFIKNGKPSDI